MALEMLRLPEVLRRRGATRTRHFNDVKRGLFPRPVKLSGGRSVGWPSTEVDLVVSLFVAGTPEDEIRQAVLRLEAERAQAGRRALEVVRGGSALALA